MKQTYKTVIVSGLVGLMLLFGTVIVPVALADPNLQISPTPAPVILPTLSPTSVEAVTSTPTRTPTPVGPALAEALEGATNVRAEPDIEGELLGQILPGEQYPILGRAEGTLWLRIQYPDTPSGTAWVFEQVVSVTGDEDLIPNIPLATDPTLDANAIGATQTLEGLALTPGALATATADAIIFGDVVEGNTLEPVATTGPLPTFTYPPTSAVQTDEDFLTRTVSTQVGDFPPIAPILGLAAAGVLGLLISFVRRAS